MRPNEEKKAMARPAILPPRFFVFFATLSWLTMAAAPASAAERALIDFLGYSNDLKSFAFEEFGGFDGVGGYYSTIYVIDTATGRFALGAPYHAESDGATEDTPLAEIRARALAAAKPQLDALHIDTPVEILYLLADGVPDADGKEATFAFPAWGPPGTTDPGLYKLTLETFDTPAATDCETMVGPARGFALVVSGQEEPVEVYRDGPLPEWRGCPEDYRLYAVVTPFQVGDPADDIAIISTYPFGFEGPDRRFLAVPLVKN
jgi:predicted secreted protein